MTPSPSPFDSLLLTIVLATLAIGLPIIFVLAIRLLWDRKLQLGRSKELEKLIWQLHRIASAMEYQMNVSFPAVQPGTEEAADVVYFQQQATPAAAPRTPAAPSSPAPAPAARLAAVQPTVAQPPAAAQPATPPPAPQQASAPAPEPTPETPAPAETQEPDFPPLVIRKPTDEQPRHAGVNSMFGF